MTILLCIYSKSYVQSHCLLLVVKNYYELNKLVCPPHYSDCILRTSLCSLSAATQKEKLRHREGKWLADLDIARHESQIYQLLVKCLGCKIGLFKWTLQL